MLKKIISGGQTGVDRAALDSAIAANLPHGGFCPKGRLCETGRIPKHYQLQETTSATYGVRTRLNVKNSDGTLILLASQIAAIGAGTLLTISEAKRAKKPLLIFYLDQNLSPALVRDWITQKRIQILNIAGPRESQSPGIYQQSYKFIKKILLCNAAIKTNITW